MRIGILTLPLHTNYGGILQAYALQTVLERMGHEASVITTSNKAELPVWKWPYSYPKRLYALSESLTQVCLLAHVLQRLVLGVLASRLDLHESL